MRVIANGRVRRSEQEWREILARWAKSGTSGREFCRQESIEISSFQRWQKKMKESPAPASTRGEFVPVSGLPLLSPSQGTPWSLEITLPSGVVLRFQG